MSEVLKIDGVGEVVRGLRQEAELSLEELADRLGWDKGRLSRYETNRRALSLPVIEAIAHALGKAPEYLVLRCLQHRYPKLAGSEEGRLLEKAFDELTRRE